MDLLAVRDPYILENLGTNPQPQKAIGLPVLEAFRLSLLVTSNHFLLLISCSFYFSFSLDLQQPLYLFLPAHFVVIPIIQLRHSFIVLIMWGM